MGLFKTAMKAVAKKVALVAAVFVGKKVLDKVMESRAQHPTKAAPKPAAKPKATAKPAAKHKAPAKPRAAAKPKTTPATPAKTKTPSL